MSQQHAGDPEEPARRDERPRPQYGEYAPEGWSWQPPAGEQTSDPAPQMATPPVRPAAGAAAASARDARPDRRGDRIATIALLVLGLLGAWLSVGVLQAMPESMQLLHSQQGLEPFTPGPELSGLILTGSIVQVVLWVATALGSFALMRAGRLSFWLPLVGGAVAAIVLFAFTVVAILGDPALLDSLATTAP
ncbi:DUF6264 family protein [Agromyces sp. NPDC049794]|uniref:DUF6264 family protein n=1 Tax=unclassified Agromyces TaxID=2639701 RepID=UPI0033CD5CD3